MQSVCVVGLGYVGLPTALVAAKAGYRVHGYDVDIHKIDRIKSCQVNASEPELCQRLIEQLASGNLSVSCEPVHADVFIIAVPTPITSDKRADVSYVWAAVEKIAGQLRTGSLLIVESTVPVGFTDQIALIIQNKTGLIVGRDVFVAHCPERVWPSRAFHELIYNDRVIGGVTHACGERAAQFYRAFVKGNITVKTAVFAELAKLIENSAIDVSVALAHQVAALAEECEFDPYELISCVNCHPRVHVWNPTCGVGGHCVAIDPWFLIERFPSKTRLFQVARAVNDIRPERVLTRIKRALTGEYGDKRVKVLVLGLTYKPDVDDLRESPALKVAQALASDDQIDLRVYDPHVESERMSAFLDIEPIDLNSAIAWADVVVFLVAHRAFTQLCTHLLKSKKVLDFCGVSFPFKQMGNNVKMQVCSDNCSALPEPTIGFDGGAMGD